MFGKTFVLASHFAIFAFVPFVAQAVEETPMSIPGGTFASVELAKEQFDKGAVFVDSRVAAEYAEKHIKGAVNVVYKETHPRIAKTDPADTFNVAKLPPDKAKALVFYCNGSPCWKGYKGAEVAIKSGYSQVYWFRDGLPAWAAKGYPVE
ncbi:MAG: rhodanese-like domain-containing protein [Candidatus Competibacteraceae bacterium]|jgi:rhodanese-related sulfurtransferase